ncbi:KN motif and ankyrin repeat domain-containing protein 3 [Megalops cyprinoides]|uniref:KN motif and ankyrin repeat domain-containing protein 3 n=1 Tax=Megalops cyprinoides TaxID=118141 RepID=UPI001864A573|nr:KN motif and ankyrin repeat domain-containing protein 3 [Megalops cyprinoides]XP_036377897.1 KN motif and ankyrin repeat domain-containing protein 3 [Megalops cyprinoides]XP_036377898.1 KN motif and ankyrin repeat domain-containing protein 3 [Megalops cyprinoides]
MTQSVQVNQKLPDLGAPFLYSTQEEADQGNSYSVQTPYGFQLDLDFLKYVEEIESGHNFRRAPINPRRGARATKLAQRSPGGGGRTSGWTSTESLSSSASEDGRAPPLPPPRNRTSSAPSESHPLSPVPILSPPLSAGLKVPPPPPVRNPRVERTLLETSRRLQQEQTQLQHSSPFPLSDPPKGGPREAGKAASVSVPSQLSPASSLTQDVHLLHPSSASPSWIRASPHNSGRSTPASGSASTAGLAPVPPGQLQTVREQMAAALKQLKDMEERVKGVPALEREVAKLRAEKDRLLLELRERTAAGGTEVRQRSPTTASNPAGGEVVVDGQGPSSPSPSHGRPSKLVELRRLTEKLGGKDEREGEQPEKVAAVQKVVMERKSVAVGDDRSLEEAVFYYRQIMKEAAVGTSVDVCDKGVCTDAVATSEVGVEAGVETKEAAVWVMESLLGLTTEAEREIDTLQDTIRFQQETIQVLESRLSQVDQEVEELRAQEEQRKSRVMVEKGVLVKPVTATAQVETDDSAVSTPAGGSLGKCENTQSVAVGCCPEVRDAGVGQNFTPVMSDQYTQTNPEKSTRKTAPAAMTSTGSQWENPYEERAAEKAAEQKPPIPALKRRQMTIAEYSVAPGAGVDSVTKGKEGCKEETVPCSPAVGMLKSIMKRKDGSSPCEPRSGSKKSLQFVGILNGGYESTSSEEEDEEEDGSSSEGSGAGGCSDSSEGEEELQEDTSDDERNVNLEDSDSDLEEPAEAENEDAEEQLDTVKEKFELSMKMREACLILKNHLNDDASALKSKEVLSSTHTVQLEWFRVSSAKTAQPSRVSDYLMAFSEVSPALLEHVVNMTDGNGNTALHYSVSHSNFTVVGLLLDTGLCCVDQQNKAGYTAIMLAALATVKEEEDMKVVKKLFSLGNVNAKASQAGQTALMLAVSHGKQEMVRALLDCGANVNVQDDEGSTALMCASEHGRTEIVSLLLEQPGCDISIVDNDGSNALSIALEASHNDIAVLLYAHMNYSKTQTAVTPKALPRSPSSPQKAWPAE